MVRDDNALDDALVQSFFDDLAEKIRTDTELFAARVSGNAEIVITLTPGILTNLNIIIYCRGIRVYGLSKALVYTIGSLADPNIETRTMAFVCAAACDDLGDSDFTMDVSLAV